MSPLASAPPVAVLTALREELSAVLRRAHSVEAVVGGRAYRGWLGGVRAIFAATGDGPPRAERIAAAVCRDFGPAALYGAGIAGALSPALAAGDLVVARRVRDRGERGRCPIPSFWPWCARREIRPPA